MGQVITVLFNPAGVLFSKHLKENQGNGVVLDMAEGLHGHNITCDQVLGGEWLKRKITMLRKNKPKLILRDEGAFRNHQQLLQLT